MPLLILALAVLLVAGIGWWMLSRTRRGEGRAPDSTDLEGNRLYPSTPASDSDISRHPDDVLGRGTP